MSGLVGGLGPGPTGPPLNSALGACAPNPSPAGSWELPKSEEKKLVVGVGVPDQVG